MGKITNFVFGAVIGAAVGVGIHYLFGPGEPSEDGAIDQVPYRSRLDAALEAGRQAAAAREAELTASFEEAKRLS